MAYTKYSLTPANNTAAPPDGAPEGMLPSAVNDTMRDMMAQIRDCGDGIRDGTYTMTAPKITGGTITGSTINNSAIGGTTAAAGKFTTLEATGVATFSAGSVSLPAITTTGDTNTGIYFPAADTIAFTEGGTEAMRINSSGNVGIGVTPSAWGTFKALQISSVGVLAANDFGSSNTQTRLATNIFYDGANFKYITTNPIAMYLQNGANHIWSYAASGTANATVTPTEAMRIDSSGNVGVGTTTPLLTAANRGNITINGSSGSIIALGVNNSSSGYFFTDSSNIEFGSATAGQTIKFMQGTESMRIDSSGRLIVGTTSAGSNQTMLTLNGQQNWSVGPSLGNSNFYVITSGGTGVYVSNGGTSWTGTSDATLKNVIAPITDGLSAITALKPTIYSWKTDKENKPYAGLLAQDVKKVLPSIIDEDVNGKLGIKYTELIPYLISSIQELKAELDATKAEVQTLKGN